MKFNMYGRTPRKKEPKWITIALISFFSFITAVSFMFGIVGAIDTQSIVPFLVILCCFAFLALLISPVYYNMNHAYIEIEGETIKVVEYPFFKKREKIVLLSDLKKAKWRAGGRVQLPYLVFKNDRNKNLFHLDYVPEVIAYVEKLGLKIEY